jgi:DNA-binding transcriptional regulator YbjK
MPANPQRRVRILDAAIDILVDTGIGGLTHRQVDDRASLPAGTTSNYFRTRLALLEATAAHTVDLHWQHVETVQTVIGRPMTRDGVKMLLAHMISDPDEQFRRRTLARFELFMEGTRRPELQPFLHDLQAAAMKTAGLILEAAGFTPSNEQVGELSRLLNGLVFSNLTISPDTPGIEDPVGTIDRLLRALLKPHSRSAAMTPRRRASR